MRNFLGGLVGHEQLKHKLAVFLGTLGGRVHNHVWRWLADTASRQGAFAFDFHHASTTVTVGSVSRCIFIAKVGNFLAQSFGGLPNRFVRVGGDVFTVQGELDFVGHDSRPAYVASTCRILPVKPCPAPED